MNKIRFLTAGESHGQALMTILEGIPAGLDLTSKDIEDQLRRRQRGYGRGDRQKIEQDKAKIMTGVRYGKTLGSPIGLLLENKDWPNWTEKMSVEPVQNPVGPLQMPRPGHADFAGMVKYRHDDLRNILERSSARETAMRVAAGAVARKLLAEFGIEIFGQVIQIENIKSSKTALDVLSGHHKDRVDHWRELLQQAEQSPVACADKQAESDIMARIDAAAEKGDTLGGIYEIVALNVPVGLGSHVHWDRRLDAWIAMAMMGINAMKSVEIGLGKGVADIPGSQVHDELFYKEPEGYYRLRNAAGGIEGGMSNGEPIIVRVAMKPLPTLSSPLRSVDAGSKMSKQAFRERSDVCAVPAAVVIAEAMLAIVLANALVDKIGGDSIAEMKIHYNGLPHVPLGW